MEKLKKEDFDEVLSLIVKELPKNHIIYDRIYEGVIAYHCSKLYLELEYDDMISLKEAARNIIEGKIEDQKINKG